MSIAYVMYLNIIIPHEETLTYKVEVVNEAMFMIVCYHLMLMTNFVSGPWERKMIGRSLIFFVMLIFAINLLIISTV